MPLLAQRRAVIKAGALRGRVFPSPCGRSAPAGAASMGLTRMTRAPNSGHPSGDDRRVFARSTLCSPRDVPSSMAGRRATALTSRGLPPVSGSAAAFRSSSVYGFLMRSGKAYLATPIGRRFAAPAPATRLVADLDANGWLDQVRRVGRSKDATAAARNAIKRFEDALFGLVEPAAPQLRIERALVALGEVGGWLAVSRRGREVVTPPPVVSRAWIRSADDGNAEFRVAAALAGLGLLPIPRQDDSAAGTSHQGTTATDGAAERQEGLQTGSRAAPPMAAHLAPIDESRFFAGQRRAWSKDESPPSMVWGAGGLVSNMIAVLERRFVETAIRGLAGKPLAGATYARLADVAAFLSGDFDDRRCAELLAGMIWARPTELPTNKQGDRYAPSSVAPFAYAAIKPIFTPDQTLRRLGALAETAAIPVPPGTRRAAACRWP